MLESLNTDIFDYERLKPEEMQKRGILGRLVGVMADTVNPTRNGRSYSSQLWDNVFQNPIMKERIENNCCFGELGHPLDREETDMEKIAIVMDGMPKKDKNGKLQAVFNILDTPNGRILKSLCDYGCNIGISSRGSGDLITDFDGNESVDPDTYNCEGWDAVIIPAVKEARLTYVNEALEKKRYNKSLRTKLQEALNKETDENKRIMTESLSSLGILLEANEETDTPDAGPKPDEKFVDSMKELTGEETEEPKNSVEEDSIQDDTEDVSVEDSFGVEEEPSSDNFTYKGVEVIKNPNNGKFVCEVDGDSYSFNTEKNARIWIDINQDKADKGYLKEEQVGRDEVKDAKNVDDVLKPEDKEETSEEDEEDKKDEEKTITVTVNESLDWTDLNGTEQSAVEAVLGRLERGEYSYLDDLYSDCQSAVNMYGEANAFDEYEDEDFYMEEGNPQNVYEYILNSPWYEEYVDKFGDLKESVNNKKVVKSAADNDGALVEQLQKLLNHNQSLEQQIITLQEKLSVSNAMEKKLKEEVGEYKHKISVLSKASKENKVLTEQLNTAKGSAAETEKQLTESKKKYSAKVKTLTENVKKLSEEKQIQENELVSLREDYDVLTRDLAQTKEQFSKKFEKQNKLLEKYQKITKNAIERYINMQATNLGVKPVEIKNRLSESFTFKDIDSVCEDLREYKLNVSKLPFNADRRLSEDMNIRARNVGLSDIIPRNDADELTEYDLKLMEAYL